MNLVFDWDGTLLVSTGYKADNLVLVLNGLGIPEPRVRELYRRYTGYPRRHIFETIYQAYFGQPLAEPEYNRLSAEFSARNIVCGKLSSLYPEVISVMTQLQRQGYQLFISSSAAQDEISALTQYFGVTPYMVTAYGSRPGFSKGPEHLGEIARTHGAIDCFVGDDEADMALAQAAGVIGVRVVRENALPVASYRCIPTLADLLK